jgi:hypothetical protein
MEKIQNLKIPNNFVTSDNVFKTVLMWYKDKIEAVSEDTELFTVTTFHEKGLGFQDSGQAMGSDIQEIV